MIVLTPGMIAVFVLCSAITVLAMLRVLANIIEHETDLHDLRNRVKELQYQRELRNAQLSGRISAESDVEILNPVDATVQAIEAAERAADAIDDSLAEPAQAA